MSEHFQYLKEGLIADLVNQVMTDYIVYSSDVFQKLSDPATALYKEGPVYIYSFLKEELEKRKN